MSECVIIVGGGPAGMALALALHRQGVAARIVDARARGAAAQDRRVLALSEGSRQMLALLGVWPRLHATAIDSIHVSQAGGFGRVLMQASEEDLPALGWVLDAGDLAAALDARLHELGLPFVAGQRIDTPPADAALTVWAEGVVSEAAAERRDYGQQAVIAIAHAETPHRGRAWERFTPQGPVAALPYHEAHSYAVVLTLPDERSASSWRDGKSQPGRGGVLPDLGRDEAAFLAELQRRFGSRLRFTGCGERYVFPLGLRYRRRPVAERQVWIGNAAQTLHPVAGQGFNLALRDIWTLACTLGEARDPGAAPTLNAYLRARQPDRYGAMGFTDFLVRSFSNDNALLRQARAAGLCALDLLPPLRSFLARRMIFGARGF